MITELRVAALPLTGDPGATGTAVCDDSVPFNNREVKLTDGVRYIT